MPPFASGRAAQAYDVLAPDGSEIRLLHQIGAVSVVHCRLPAGAVSTPVRHRTVEEIWYFLAGRGQVWRRQDQREEVLDVGPGMSLTIPLGTDFQFRAMDEAPLEFLIATTPPWPGEEEAVLLEAGRWAWGLEVCGQ